MRLEDTDQSRFVPGAEDYIVESLKWCGIEIDEGVSVEGPHGPYRQSERKAMYREYADQLIASGHAYYAFDSTDDLTAMRERMKAAGVPSPQYNYITREHMQNSLVLPHDQVEARLAKGDPYVIRIKMPRNEEVKFEDIIRGWVSVNTNNLDDKVLFKSDGMPTYHLANIVDDHLMEITHVIRGEEWLPSAPLHVLLYRYLGWEMPQFAHLPLILKPDGNGKLSKRDGDRLGFPVFPLQWNPAEGESSSGYREQGYFPGAFINMLAFLGWNPGTNEELFSMKELIERFSLARVNKAGARFDPDKTRWFNQQYLRSFSDQELGLFLQPLTSEAGYSVDVEYCAQVASVMKERATFVREMLEDGRYFFEAPSDYDEKGMKKWKEETPEIVRALHDIFLALDDFSSESVDKAFHGFMEARELGFGKVGPGFRLALTGKGMGPSLPDIAAIIGKEETLARLNTALEKLG